jgi:hypothetical protein
LRRGTSAPPRTTAGRAYTSGADMAVKLNHTIVHARDKRAAAQFYAEVFGLGAPRPIGPFLDVDTANEVTLAFLQTDQAFEHLHYGNLGSDDENYRSYARVKTRWL